MVRLSTLDLNHLAKAVKYRTAILSGKRSKRKYSAAANREYPFDEDVKMVLQHMLNPKRLTLAEKDEVVAKYENGMTMTAIADQYGCHYTTIGRLLRQRGVTIRGIIQD